MEPHEQTQEQHTRKERQELKRAEKTEEKARNKKAHIARKFAKTFSFFLVVGGIIAFGIWSVATRPATPKGDILAENGMHWHSKLKIVIEGKEQEIPTNIGIGVTHNPIHTHDATGEIHLEFSGLVKKDDVKLGNFFKLWGKQFSSSCVLDSCAKDDKTVKMLVHGKENMEFENYLMQDKDSIEIRYE